MYQAEVRSRVSQALRRDKKTILDCQNIDETLIQLCADNSIIFLL
jgi:hypothetical protein